MKTLGNLSLVRGGLSVSPINITIAPGESVNIIPGLIFSHDGQGKFTVTRDLSILIEVELIDYVLSLDDTLQSSSRYYLYPENEDIVLHGLLN